MKVEVIRAWPHRHESRQLDLTQGSNVEQALRAAGWQDDAATVGYAVHGVMATLQTTLQEGDRLELLRPLQIDPKEARRRRAGKA